MNEKNKQNRNRLMDRIMRDVVSMHLIVRGKREWVKKVKGYSKKIPPKLIDTGNSLMITRGEGDRMK